MMMQKARCIINAYLRALSILAASANPFQDTATIFIAKPIVISAIKDKGCKEGRPNTAKISTAYRIITIMSVAIRPEKIGVNSVTMVLRPVLSSSGLLISSAIHTHRPAETTSGIAAI